MRTLGAVRGRGLGEGDGTADVRALLASRPRWAFTVSALTLAGGVLVVLAGDPLWWLVMAAASAAFPIAVTSPAPDRPASTGRLE